MDSLRGDFYDADIDPHGHDPDDDGEALAETPPSTVGQDERRMQVRAYNFWASLLDNRNYPSIEDLDPSNLPDFGPNSVLLDFSAGVDNPAVPFLGEKLAEECGTESSHIANLDDVPSRSLLSRITDHYMQILANQAPIGFEAEFVNQDDHIVLYRGILLPFSSDDDTIDFIYGVINWKELADQNTSDALMLEVDQSLERSLAEDEDADDANTVEEEKFPPAPEFNRQQVDGWADGPEDSDEDSDLVEDDAAADDRILTPRFATIGAPVRDDDNGMSELPEPRFGLRRTVDMIKPPVIDPDDDTPLDLGSFVETDSDEPEDLSIYAPNYGDTEESELVEHASYGSLTGGYADSDEEDEYEDEDEDVGAYDTSGDDDAPPVPDAYEPEPGEASEPDFVVAAEQTDAIASEGDAALAADPADRDDMGLADWLASARELAQRAMGSEERTRHALYGAIGRAYDFSIAAEENPGDFEQIVAEAGLTVQERAPMTPVVKLVFGADYDKTRITEYATALSHGHRLGLPRGTLSRYLSETKGGLKAVVREERKLRRAEKGEAVEENEGVREAIADQLRELDPIAFDDIPMDGAEFAVVMVRREADGRISVLGEVPEDVPLLERAARKLLD